jgi:thymidine kinase
MTEAADQTQHSRPRHHGWIEVITGSMFSGKSEELIRRLRRAQIARQKVQIFKPLIDNRFSENHIVSHSDMRIESVNVRGSDELVKQVDEDTEVVGIDEGQFFDANRPAACNTLADVGKRVIVAGLDQDYLGRPFEPMPQLLAIAEYITKTLAICVVYNPSLYAEGEGLLQLRPDDRLNQTLFQRFPVRRLLRPGFRVAGGAEPSAPKHRSCGQNKSGRVSQTHFAPRQCAQTSEDEAVQP